MTKQLTCGSLFSGVGGFDLGFERAGFDVRWQVEIDPSCRDVLCRNFPNVEVIYTDVRTVNREMLAPVDIIIGGFPCQDLSVAGRRAGLGGERSGLFFEFARIIRELRPRFAVFENVPGLLSSNGGRDFAVVLAELGDIGALDIGWAVLDAQWFGVPQRRRRVFIVADFGGRCAAAILSLAKGLQGHPAPRRETGQGVAAGLTRGSSVDSNAPGRRREDDVNLVTAPTQSVGAESTTGFAGPAILAHSLSATGTYDRGDGADTLLTSPTLNAQNSASGVNDGIPLIAAPLVDAGKRQWSLDSPNFVYQCQGTSVGPMGSLRRGNGNETGGVPFLAFDMQQVTSVANRQRIEPGRPAPTLHEAGGAHVIQEAVAFNWHRPNMSEGAESPTVTVSDGHAPAIAFDNHGGASDAVTETLRSDSHGAIPMTVAPMAVRRLMPEECERLMGWPDSWTKYGASGKEMSDSTRYRMCGNGVVASVSEWIARQIKAVMA